jgi:hypothetical protein
MFVEVRNHENDNPSLPARWGTPLYVPGRIASVRSVSKKRPSASLKGKQVET